ncbi:uncharacterized protein [Arachis hypogaea]|uniref:uncharacterized protein n=1 Tax=Arachis hypogaea TaxID=3818 RepID=UPI0007AF0B07
MNLIHTCTQAHRVGILHSKWLGKAFKKKVESNPKVKTRELVSKAQKKWNLTVTKSLATKTKQIALDQIQETFREQYKRIYDYGQELMRANPGSSVRLQVQRSPYLDSEAPASSRTTYCIFQRIYVCLEACKQCFQHCRDSIGLDGCFLKTPQGGQLLTAIGWDPNDQMLPIAYAVVEAETKGSWNWFLSHLVSDVWLDKMGRSTFMSDQQKGLLPAYEEVIPGVDNRFCVRHLYSNFRKKFPGLQLKKLMWKCAKATHWRDWERHIAEVKAVNQEAYRYLIAIPPRYWSRSRFTYNSKVDTLVNNMSESFNSTIVDAREKPIVTMLEEIRVKLMTRLAENRELAQNYSGTILPRIRFRLEKRSRLAGDWRPNWSAASKYEVVNELDKFAVDLGSHECSCRIWQMSGIPCVHAISCIKFKGLDLEPFVAGSYKKETYMRCYDSIIHPLNRVDIWERTAHSDVMPPPYRRPSHRPVKKRRAAAGDEEQSSRTHLSRKGEKQRCSLYGSVGHNRSRCPKPIEELQSKNKGKQQQGSTKSNHLSAKGGRKTASSQPNPKQSVKRKAVSATQPPSAAQSNNAAQPKRPRGRPKKTTKPKSSTQSAPQPNKVASPTSSAPPSSSSQPATRTIPSSQPTLTTSSSQPVGHFSTRLSGAPHISPKKLKLMSKLPPSKWEML